MHITWLHTQVVFRIGKHTETESRCGAAGSRREEREKAAIGKHTVCSLGDKSVLKLIVVITQHCEQTKTIKLLTNYEESLNKTALKVLPRAEDKLRARVLV